MNFTIRARIALVIVAGLVTLAVMVAVSLIQKARVDRNIQLIATSTNKIEWVTHLQMAIERSLMPANDYLILGNATGDRAEFSHLTGVTEDLLKRIEEPDFLIEEERVFLSKVRTDLERFKAAGEEILAISNPVGNARGPALMERFDAMGAEIVLYVGQLLAIHENKLTQILDETDRSQRQAQHQLVGSGVVAGILLLIIGAWLGRSLLQPIRDLERGMQHIAAGSWDHRVDIRTRDELEGLAAHFNSMAEELGVSYRSIQDHVADLAALLEISTEISAALEVDQLLTLMSERMTRVLKTTYCRIALMDGEQSSVVIRAAYPIRTMDWEPGIGRSLDPHDIPELRKAFETSRYVHLTKDEIHHPEKAAEREQLLTPQTQSALILPLFLKNQPQGVIILGEARSREREPFTPEKMSICQTMANQVAVAISNSINFSDLQEMVVSTVTAMAHAIDAKSPWTQGHSVRVTSYAVALGEQLGLDSVVLGHLRLGCLLHDIGKIGTDGTILCKSDGLTDEEMAVMRLHTVKGEEIIKPIRQLSSILPVIRYHHERYDGTGYPDGLSGEAIPIIARVAALADAFDAMIADRPYRKGLGRNEAIAEIKRGFGTQFDPSIAEVFVGMLEQADFGAALLMAAGSSMATESGQFIKTA